MQIAPLAGTKPTLRFNGDETHGGRIFPLNWHNTDLTKAALHAVTSLVITGALSCLSIDSRAADHSATVRHP